MTGETGTSVLWRKLRRAAGAVPGDPDGVPGAGPVTPSRALRTTFARSAAEAADLTISVLGLAMDDLGLDDLLDRVGTGFALLSLESRAGPVGFVGADAETRAALIEVQTTGRLSPLKADRDRAATRTDAALMAPLFARFLAELPAACAGSVLDGWVDGIGVGPYWDSPRMAALLLEDQTYRLVRMTLDFGLADRQGEVVVALPVFAVGAEPERVVVAAPVNPWPARFQDAVLGAPAEIEAVLHRFQLSLRSVEAFEVGQVLALPGVTVGSVQLTGPGRQVVALARLGQMSGLRAVRIEVPGRAEMRETPIRAAPTGMPDPGRGVAVTV